MLGIESSALSTLHPEIEISPGANSKKRPRERPLAEKNNDTASESKMMKKKTTTTTTTSSKTTSPPPSAPSAEDEVPLLEGKIAETQGRIDEAQGRIDQTQGRIDRKEAEVVQERSKDNPNEEYIKVMISGRAGLEAEKATLVAQMSTLQKQLDPLVERQAELMRKRTRLEQTFPPPEPPPRFQSEMEASGFLTQLLTKPLSKRGLRVDEFAQREALGELYLHVPNKPWPVLAGRSGYRVDMRLFPRKDFGHEDELTPVARAMSNDFVDRVTSVHPDNFISVGLIAASGSGKTHSIFTLGHEHYVIYLQASVQSDMDRMMQHGEVEPRKILTGEYDPKFVALVSRLTEDLTKRKDVAEHRLSAWKIAERRCFAHLLARLVELVKLREMEPEITPIDFLHHQIAGGDVKFWNATDEALLPLASQDLTKVAAGCRERLRSLLEGNRRLVVAIDEVEATRKLLEGSFQSTLDSQPIVKGLLSPLARAAGNLARQVGVHLVFAGTGTSKNRIVELHRSDVGKVADPPALHFQDHFPVITSDDVIRVLRGLNLGGFSTYDGVIDKPLIQRPLAVPASGTTSSSSSSSTTASTETTGETLRTLIETYVVGARGRLLAGIIERIGLHKARPNEALHRALGETVGHHSKMLLQQLSTRLGPGGNHQGSPPVPVSTSIPYLQRCFIAATLTNREAAFSLSDCPLLESGDLSEIGVSCARERTVNDEVADKIAEQFVVDALAQYFEGAKQFLHEKKFDEALELLRGVLEKRGAASQFKGNVIERLAMDRLIALAGGYRFVGELPFVKPFIKSEKDMVWLSVPFGPKRVGEPRLGSMDTPNVLAGNEAQDYVWWPEDVCRPDAIVMLGRLPTDAEDAPRRAFTLASAVYTGPVPKEKAEDQLKSSDLSRAFLNKDAAVTTAAAARRKAWCEKNLHTTRCVRVIINLPSAVNTASRRSPPKVLSEDGRMWAVRAPVDDLIVMLDKTNVHLLLGKPKRDPSVKNLFNLLVYVTGTTKQEWGM